MLNRLVKSFYKLLPDALYHWVKYFLFFKRAPDLAHPSSFSEKMLQRKLHPRSIYTTLSDKYKVREFIAALWGTEYLVELYAHGKELSYDIFNELPQSFVLKANHGSGYNKLVFDKSQIGYAELYDLSSGWLRSNFYDQNREKHYQGIEPCIIVEHLLLDNGEVPNDIKFHCFNHDGEILMFIQMDYRNGGSRQRDIFDIHWNRTEIRVGLPNAEIPAERPSQLDKMIMLANKVANQFSYVRVDCYQVAGRVYFGELTFTPGAGLMHLLPNNIEQEWGSYFQD